MHNSVTMFEFPVQDKLYSEILSGVCSLENGPWVAGGSARKVWQGKSWIKEDVDFFFRDEQQFQEFNALLNSGKFVTKYGYDHATNNAVTSTVRHPSSNELFKIQAVKKNWHKSYRELVDGFDFHISQFVSDGKVVIGTENAIVDCNTKQFTWNKNSLSQLKPLRVLKYMAYGFDPDHDMLKKAIKLSANGEMGFNEY